MRTGIATIPKLIAPRHMDRAIPHDLLFAGLPGLYGRAPKRCSDCRLQPLRVKRAQRFVLEVGVDVAATVQVAGNPPNPGGAPLRRVRVAAQPQVDERTAPERPRLFLAIAVDERRPQTLQERSDLRRVPGAVAELEGDAPVRWEQGYDPLDPALIEGRAGRQLKEDRAQPIAKGRGLLRQHPDRLLQVGHAAVVRDSPVGLDREAEVRRDACDPAGDDALRLRPIEGGVDLDRWEVLRVIAQHLRRLDAAWIEPPTPTRIGKPRRADEELGHVPVLDVGDALDQAHELGAGLGIRLEDAQHAAGEDPAVLLLHAAPLHAQVVGLDDYGHTPGYQVVLKPLGNLAR